MIKTAALITDHSGQLGRNTQRERDLATAAKMNNFLRGVERRAFVIARLATQDEEESLDIVQDAMFKLVQKYSAHPEVEWGALFHAILHSRINDWHRRQKVQHPLYVIGWTMFWIPVPSTPPVRTDSVF